MSNSQLPDDEAEQLTGFAPLTADYLLQRGYCCGNGCKNCPFDYKMVPEPRRTQLLELRQQKEQE